MTMKYTSLAENHQGANVHTNNYLNTVEHYYNISLRIMTGHEINNNEPCDLIINIQWSVVTSPSNEQEGSNK